MPKYEFLPSVAQQRFWPLLTVSLLLFVVGTFFWYSVDSSEVYFKNYEIQHYLTPPLQGNALQMPWWQLDVAPGDISDVVEPGGPRDVRSRVLRVRIRPTQ